MLIVAFSLGILVGWFGHSYDRKARRRAYQFTDRQVANMLKREIEARSRQ